MIRYKGSKLPWPKDLLIKLISLLFAVFLWYFVAGEDRVDMNVQIPVEIVNLPRNLIISNQFKNQLEVTVSGPRGMIRKISQQEISRSIDLSDAEAGNVVIRNDNDAIKFPRGIRVLRIQPSHIILLLDRLIQKELPIQYVTRGKLPPEFENIIIKLQPDKLTLSGPQAILSTEEIIKTVPIDLSALSGPTTNQVSLNLRQEVADLIGDPIVTVKITMQQKIVSREVRKINIEIRGLDDESSARLSPRIVKAQIKLPLLFVNSGNDLKSMLTAYIDVKDLAPGNHEIAVTIDPAPEITINSITPASINVLIK